MKKTLILFVIIVSSSTACLAAFGIFMVGQPVVTNSFLLLESGDFLLLENGSKLVLE